MIFFFFFPKHINGEGIGDTTRDARRAPRRPAATALGWCLAISICGSEAGGHWHWQRKLGPLRSLPGARPARRLVRRRPAVVAASPGTDTPGTVPVSVRPNLTLQLHSVSTTFPCLATVCAGAGCIAFWSSPHDLTPGLWTSGEW